MVVFAAHFPPPLNTGGLGRAALSRFFDIRRTGISQIGDLLCGPVFFGNSKNASFRILAVNQPPDAGDGHFGNDHFPAVGNDFGGEVIYRSHIDGVDVANGAFALEQPAVDARFVVRAGGNQPLVLRAGPLFDFPVEDFGVKVSRPLGVFGRDFEVNDAGHSRVSF